MEVAREIQRLSADARAGRLRQDDLRGGTLTISNIGSIGGIYSTPIIFPPEVAIVALGRYATLSISSSLLALTYDDSSTFLPNVLVIKHIKSLFERHCSILAICVAGLLCAC